MGADPVELGLVSSLSPTRRQYNRCGRPRCRHSRKAPATASRVSACSQHNRVSPQSRRNPYFSALETGELQSAATVIGVRLLLLDASIAEEIEASFAKLVEQRADAFLLGTDPFFITARDLLVSLANRHMLPAIYPFREDVIAGGLASYGASNRDAFRLVGGYTGRILKGEKPADLPVQQATKIELYINLKTAKVLGITLPIPILGRADEVIE